MPKKVLLLLLGFVGLVINSSNYVESIIIPSISNEFCVEAHQAGIIATGYFLCFGLSAAIGGPLADRYGKIEMIIFSALFFGIAMILSSLASGLGNLALARALSGIFAAPILPVSNALISDIFSSKERQLALGIFQGICMLGQSLCMLIAGMLVTFWGWRSVYALIAACTFISIFPLIPFRKYVTCKNKDTSIIESYKAVLCAPAICQTFLVILVQGGLILGLISYLGAYMKDIMELDYFTSGLVMATFGITTLIFSSIGSKLAIKWGRQRVILVGLFFGTLANICLLLRGKLLLSIITAIAFLGLTFIFSHVTLLSMVSEFSVKARGTALAVVACCFISGGSIGAAIGGYLIGNLGYQTLFSLFSLIFVSLIFAIGLTP